MTGISFSETMSGMFHLGATDPEEGARRGRAARTRFTLNADIKIDDIDHFVRDPGHNGALTGRMSFVGLGADLPSTSGVFQLFNPGDNEKRMVYEMGFDVDGAPHYFAGEKIVKDDPGFDLWDDTTTLFSRVHRGADGTGEVIGAGVLRLGFGDLLALLRTLRVPGADGSGEAVGAVAKFGRFFFGELWDAYIARLHAD